MPVPKHERKIEVDGFKHELGASCRSFHFVVQGHVVVDQGGECVAAVAMVELGENKLRVALQDHELSQDKFEKALPWNNGSITVYSMDHGDEVGVLKGGFGVEPG